MTDADAFPVTGDGDALDHTITPDQTESAIRHRTTTQTAAREVQEEAGITIEITGLVGVYSDPRYVIAYDNREVRQ